MNQVATIDKSAMLRAFAEEIIRLGAARDQGTGLQAAMNVAAMHPEYAWDRGTCMRVSEIWLTDPDLQAELNRIRDERGEIGFGYTKREYLENLRALSSKNGVQDKDKIGYLRLFADVAGYIQKDAGPTVNVQTNVGIANNVMRLPSEVPLDEWEVAATRQQDKLIEHASGD